MDRFTYLILDLGIIAMLVVLAWRRRDLWPMCLKLGLLGGLAGFVGELFYFRDYWQPPSTTGVGVLSPEDFLFGGSIIAFAAALYPVLTKRRLAPRRFPRRMKQLYGLFALGFIALLCGNLVAGINSILVSSLYFDVALVIMLWQRRDLAPVAGFAALVGTGLITIWYAVLFNGLAPTFWQQHWLLYHTRLGGMILGNIPLAEILWYVSWIALASVCYHYALGYALISNKEEDAKTRAAKATPQ